MHFGTKNEVFNERKKKAITARCKQARVLTAHIESTVRGVVVFTVCVRFPPWKVIGHTVQRLISVLVKVVPRCRLSWSRH